MGHINNTIINYDISALVHVCIVCVVSHVSEYRPKLFERLDQEILGEIDDIDLIIGSYVM